MAMQTLTGQRPAGLPKSTNRRPRRERLSLGWRKGVLTVHEVLSVGWIGLTGCLIALAVVGLDTGDAWVYRAIGLLGGTFLLPVSLRPPEVQLCAVVNVDHGLMV